MESDLTKEQKAALRKQRKAQKKAAKDARVADASSAKKEKKDVPAKGQGKRAKDIRLKTAFENKTPKGQKKIMDEPMANAYDPPAVEAAWYDWWSAQGYFKPDTSKQEQFVMVIPPPNVTGALHMGHALTNSIQDSLVRWNRMKGRCTLWVPGTDHAGIATQSVVEKRLAKERQVTRHDLGREAFCEEVMNWKNEYRDRIVSQLKRIGSSLDWEREAFTMDNNFSRAVLEAFIRLFNEKLIFRDNRLVNWCCHLQSTISDLEVDHLELDGKKKLKVPGYDRMVEFGELVHFAYKVEDSDEELIVATTRIETMVGDTAVAIHPNDERYKHLHGKRVVHPFRNTTIPIILDGELVKMEFGTGAVKVTPAHDPNDYLCGKRNNLEFINILNDDGTYNENTGKYAGMARYNVRYAIIADLTEMGLLKKREPHSMILAICSRTGDIIEPTLKPQWWVNCEDMAKDALAAVENGDVELIPPNPHKGTWQNYLGNIQPWCISRQLWWGHRIPAYRVSINGTPVDDENGWVVGRSAEEAMENATKQFCVDGVTADQITLAQDEDVLDTWFSSGIFPIGVFGWPEQTEDLERFYPTSLLETGKDILFFWVMRMVMMCQKLTGKLPFKQVFLHTMVRDAHGRKMSKSLGNVIDPINVVEGVTLEDLGQILESGNLSAVEIKKAKAGQKQDFPKGISECGTDAMRFSICSYSSQGTDINLDILKVVSVRNFCNKLWNAIRFGLSNLGDDYQPESEIKLLGGESREELWILSRLAHTAELMDEGWRNYDFTKATDAIYSFWLNQLCSVYLESSKPVFNSDDEEAKKRNRNTLYLCYDMGLRLLHPFMPYVTEELWQRLPRRPSDPASIMISEYPTDLSAWRNETVEEEMNVVEEVVHHLRAMRAAYNIPHKTATETFINCKTAEAKEMISQYSQTIQELGSAQSITLTDEDVIKGCSVEIVNPSISVFIQLQGIVDIDAEVKKLQNMLTGVKKSLATLEERIASPMYQGVPVEKQEVDKQKVEELKTKIATGEKALAGFQ